MSSKLTVALAGATGNLGPAILKELLDASFQVRILSRTGSKSLASIKPHPAQTVKEVDYSSKESLVSALTGVDVAISTLSNQTTPEQKLLIDASIEAGVKRFLPSEFGSDTVNPDCAKLPVFGGKIAVQKYLKETVAKNPDFSYTLVMTSAFWDWGIKVGFIVNAKDHFCRLIDGGKSISRDSFCYATPCSKCLPYQPSTYVCLCYTNVHSPGDRPFSLTRLSTIGKGVVGILHNLPATANRPVYIHDTALSLNRLVSEIQAIDHTSTSDWSLPVVSSDDLVAESYAELKKPEPNIMKAMVDFLPKAIIGEGYGGDFTGRTDNELLGVKEVKGDDEIREIMKQIVQA